MVRYTRRQFLGAAAAGAISLKSLGRGQSHAGLSKRPLGSTGLDVTILGLGCATLGYGGHSVPDGARIVEACLDGGVTYIDCASSYRNAEVKVGEIMKDRRKEVILATKVLERDKNAAWREINRSLERLRTDRVDVLQLHAINSMSDLGRIRSDDGALHAAIRAKKEGLCSHIGITGHTRPNVLAAALEAYPFETVLIPLSSTDALVNDFAPVILPSAQKHGAGIIAMKVLAAGRMTRYPVASIRYSMSLPVSTAIVGMGTLDEVKQNVAIASAFEPMTGDEMDKLRKKTASAANTDVLWWKRT